MFESPRKPQAHAAQEALGEIFKLGQIIARNLREIDLLQPVLGACTINRLPGSVGVRGFFTRLIEKD